MIVLLCLAQCFSCWAALGLLGQDPFRAHLFPPELIVQHREEIDLSERQLNNIREIVESVQSELSELSKRVTEASRGMSEILSADDVSESQAIEYLDKFLEAEKAVKHRHLALMLRLRNELTIDQRKQLFKKVSQRHDARQPVDPNQQRLRQKVDRIRREMERRVQNGSPPMEAAELMNEFGPKFQTGQIAAAEKILDQVIKMLDLDNRDENNNVIPKRPAGKDDVPIDLLDVPVMPRQSQRAVQKTIESLHEPEVAWRKIDWETCLLKGLQRSRNEQKPVLLWVFIDRPVDDERC